MDKLQRYRQVVRELLADCAHPYSHSDEVDTEIICDVEHDHYQLSYIDLEQPYQLSYIGWEEQQHIFNLILHLDIKDGKIWVQHNGTEMAIAQVLVEQSVPASDIVLGFHSPFKRQFSGYAVA